MYAASFIRLRNNISFLFCNRLKKQKQNTININLVLSTLFVTT